MRLNRTEITLLTKMAASETRGYAVTTGPGRRPGGPRVGARELAAMRHLIEMGCAQKVGEASEEGTVRGPTSKKGLFYTLHATITNLGRQCLSEESI